MLTSSGNRDFTMLPNFVFRPEIAAKIGPIGIALVAALIHEKATPKKGPSIRYLTSAVGTTPARVIGTLRMLDTEGIVTVVKHRVGQQNGYDLHRIEAALRGESVPTGGTSTVPLGDTVLTKSVPTDGTNSKTVDSIPRELPDLSGDSKTIQHNGDDDRGVLSTAPLDPTASGEAPRSETPTEPLHQLERFGPAPDRTTFGFMVLELFLVAGAENVWHATFDKLIQEHGIDVVWEQFNYLATRVVRSKEGVKNIAGLFIKSVEDNYSPPSGEFVDKAAFEKWCRDRAVQAADHDECIPFACSFTGGNCPEPTKSANASGDDSDGMPF